MSDGPARRFELTSFAVLALLAVGPTLLASGHVVGDGVDLWGTFWFYAWIKDCLLHLRDPSFTTLMFYPLGKDIFAHTGNNFVDAALSVPFQLVFGFPRYEPWFVAALLFGNALGFRPLARQVLGPTWAAWGATLLWMLNPYVLFECMTGRFTQALMWFAPLSFMWFLRIPQAATLVGWARWKPAVLAGLLCAAQAYTYWFMGYFMALGFAWLALLALVAAPQRKRTAVGYAVAGLACVLAVLPAGIAMALRARAGEVPGLVGESGSIWDGPVALANNVAQDLHGYALMERWGQPMFGYWVWGGGALLFLIFGRDRLRWGGLAALVLAFAIGPVLELDDSHRLLMPHYLVAYHSLPFFDRLWFPYRMVCIAFLGVSLGLGSLLLRLAPWAAARRLPGWLLPGLLVGATAAEQHPNLAFPLLHRDFTPPALYSVIGQTGGALIELPIGMSRISVAWQAVHMQPTWGGMGENARLLWPPGFDWRQKNSFIRYLRVATSDTGGVSIQSWSEPDRQSLLREGFRWIVLDRQLADSALHREELVKHGRIRDVDSAVFVVTDGLVSKLGPPVATDGALVAWDLVGGAVVPEALKPTEANLHTRSWPVDDMPEYEAHLREMGRIRETPAPGSRKKEKSSP